MKDGTTRVFRWLRWNWEATGRYSAALWLAVCIIAALGRAASGHPVDDDWLPTFGLTALPIALILAGIALLRCRVSFERAAFVVVNLGRRTRIPYEAVEGFHLGNYVGLGRSVLAVRFLDERAEPHAKSMLAVPLAMQDELLSLWERYAAESGDAARQ